MNKYPVSVYFNPHASNIEDFIRWAQQVKPHTIVVLAGSLELCDQMYRALDGKTEIVARQYHPREGDLWNQRTPEQIVNQWDAEGYKHIWRDTVNEPHHQSEEFMEKLVEVMGLCVEREIKLDVLKASVASYDRREVFRLGLYDEMLELLSEFPQYLRLAVHEYWHGSARIGTGHYIRGYIRNIPDPLHGLKEMWEDKRHIPRGYDNLYLGRMHLLNARADELGLDRPRIYVAEYGYDRLSDFTQGVPEASKALDRYATNYHELQGWLTYWNILGCLFPKLTPGEAYLKEIWYGIKHYPKNVECVNLFMWGATDSHRKEGFECNETTLREAIIRDSREFYSKDKLTMQGTIEPIFDYVNERSEPTTDSVILGRLSEPEHATVSPQGNWYEVTYTNTDVTVYINKEWANFYPDSESPGYIDWPRPEMVDTEFKRESIAIALLNAADAIKEYNVPESSGNVLWDTLDTLLNPPEWENTEKTLRWLAEAVRAPFQK